MTAISKITRNRLSDSEVFTLGTWIVSNKDLLNGISRPVIAARASKALTFTVTPKHVDRAIAATGVVLAPMSPRSTAAAKNKSHLAKQVFIAAALRDLMVSLGHPVPNYLDRIISNQTMENISAAYEVETKGARQ